MIKMQLLCYTKCSVTGKTDKHTHTYTQSLCNIKMTVECTSRWNISVNNVNVYTQWRKSKSKRWISLKTVVTCLVARENLAVEDAVELNSAKPSVRSLYILGGKYIRQMYNLLACENTTVLGLMWCLSLLPCSWEGMNRRSRTHRVSRCERRGSGERYCPGRTWKDKLIVCVPRRRLRMPIHSMKCSRRCIVAGGMVQYKPSMRLLGH